MDKAITTALLIVISMMMALMLFNVAYPAIIEGGEVITRMAGQAEDRLRTQIRIIHASAEVNAAGIGQDTNANGDIEVFVWVKNVGDLRIIALDQLDIFFGPEGNFARIPSASISAGRPNWTWQLEDAADWTPGTTLRLTLHYGGVQPAQGQYFFRITLPNGVSDSLVMGI